MAATRARGDKKARRFAVTDHGILLALALVCAAWLAAQVWPVIVASILVGTLIPAVRLLQRLGLGRTGGLAIIFVVMVAGLLLIGFVTIPRWSSSCGSSPTAYPRCRIIWSRFR